VFADAPDVLRIEEAAELVGVSRSSMYSYVHSGLIPAIRLGRRLRIAKSSLIRFLENPPPID
jgi:excisionase family DNA binding protein